MFAARGQVATEHVCGCRFWSMILRREQLRWSRTHTHRKVEVTVFRRMCLSSSRVCSLGFGRWWWGHARGEYEDRFSSWGDRKRFDVDACRCMFVRWIRGLTQSSTNAKLCRDNSVSMAVARRDDIVFVLQCSILLVIVVRWSPTSSPSLTLSSPAVSHWIDASQDKQERLQGNEMQISLIELKPIESAWRG